MVAMEKAAFSKNILFISTLDLNLRKKTVKCYIWCVVCEVQKLGHLGKQIRNTWKVLKCGAGEGWRISVGPIV
jgi:hypothetical protein